VLCPVPALSSNNGVELSGVVIHSLFRRGSDPEVGLLPIQKPRD
jgi:hypothetical protein